MAAGTESTGKVVAMKSATDRRQSEKKWGLAVMKPGYCILPSMLLRAQARLSINCQQMIILLQLIEHWWAADSKIYPSKKTIAERVRLTDKQVQRHMATLEKKGLLLRIERRLPGRGKTSNEYDLTGLVKKLNEIAVDFTEAEELKKAAARPGGIRAAKAAKQAAA